MLISQGGDWLKEERGTHVGDLWHQGVVGVRVSQQRADGQEHLCVVKEAKERAKI